MASSFRLTPAEKVRIIACADRGYTIRRTAIATGRSVWAVLKYGKGRFSRHRPVTIARLRRMIVASDAADYGARDAVAHRFGLANANSLKATISFTRRRLRERGLLPADLERAAA